MVLPPPSTMGSLRTWLAAWRDIVREFTFFYGVDRNRQVDQHPVEEIHAGQTCRNNAAFLIDVVAFAWDIGVVTDDNKGAGADWRFGPRKLRVQVLAQADVVGGIGNTKGKFARNFLSVGKAGAGQFHWMVFLPVRRLAA